MIWDGLGRIWDDFGMIWDDLGTILGHPSKMNELITNYVDWGAGPRASKNIILASKCHALINGKYSPDIEDVKAVSIGVF